MVDLSHAFAPDRALSLVQTLSQRASRQLDRLDHWPLEAWIGAPGLRFAGSDAAGWAGILVVPVDTGGPVAWRTRAGGPAWIRWVAVDAVPAGPQVRVLLAAAVQLARNGGMDGLWLLCDAAGWLDPYLRDDGYRAVDEVITLERSAARIRRPMTASAVDPSGRPVERARFRGASADDLDAVAGLDARAFGDPWRYAPATLARELSMASVARVALDGDRVIGYATAVVREGGGHINRIAVDPEAQGRGVGKALLADINGQLDLMGANRITLNTQRSNVISQRLYRSSGFKIVGPPLRVYHRPLA